MKNKKVISLTVVLIGAVIAGVIGMSKLLETYWQTTDSKDNNLTVNENNFSSEKSVFDYPYFDVKEHNKLTDNAVRERYISDINLYEITLTQDDENKIIIANVDKAPTSDMVSYQQVANVCGEAVKYLYGMTEHQNFPSAITYYYNISSKGKENVYSYRLRIDEHYIEFLVDSYTGEICSVSTSGGLVIELNENAEEDRITDFLTDDIKSSLIALANENLDVLGNSRKIERYEFIDMHRMLGCNRFTVRISHTDATESWMNFATVDFDYYELTGYRITK
ncbi:MAG: hypothetical protein IKK99_09680 [Oscillospiraceae bacterium]|nr:hypothetical protein [Oscillospiraceae bacterium]